MNPDSPNQRPQLRQNQNQEAEQNLAQQTSATQQAAALEFATGEEAIRHDAAQTPLPPAIAERLRKSIENEPKQSESWWKKIFGS
jgi:hypothetical protein